MMTMEKLVDLYHARDKAEEELRLFTNERNQALTPKKLGILSVEEQILRDIRHHMLYEALTHYEKLYDRAIAVMALQQ